MTKTGVWNRSAMSNDSTPKRKHSSTVPGKRRICRVSAVGEERGGENVALGGRVGKPVDGPTRCTSQMTAGISAK
jgi:hypothetical protein